ncbi:conserved exported hypothetical protein [Mesorhizobium sp. ORS 3324]|nr:conserved exported hypothetical protein [Mesorhizobium sp. ORS 3324]
MKTYFAAALTIGIAIGPALALDAGVSGEVGGVGVDAGSSAGSQGAAVGAGASADGVGGTNVGASAGGDGSLGAGVSTSGNLGGVSAGVSPTGIGVGDDPSAASGSAKAPENPGAVTTATASAKTRHSRAADGELQRVTNDGELQRVTKGYPFGFLAPLQAKPGAPAAVVRACRAAITRAAMSLGAVRVYAASAGPLRQRRGALTAPIEVRIAYKRQGGIEVRQARVDCRLDTAGKVTAVVF